MIDDYVIDNVGWHTQAEGNPETPEQINLRFRSLLLFLEKNELLSREVIVPDGPLPDSFEVRSSDLTAEGVAIMKAGYDKWLGALDHGTDPQKLTILDRALKSVRGGSDA